MKYLSFHTFIICVLLPPAMYLITLQGLEIYFQNKWTAELQKDLVFNAAPFMEGKERIEDEIAKKIEHYLQKSDAVKVGIAADIFVKTNAGRLLYPQFNLQKPGPYITHKQGKPASLEDMTRAAESNRQIMQDGIDLVLRATIPRNSWLAHGILTLYMMLFVFLPYWAYLSKTKEARSLAREAKELEISKQKAVDAVNKKLTDAQEKLAQASAREMMEQAEIEQLKEDLSLAGAKALKTENEALVEIEMLDRNLQKSVQLKEEMELEVLRLEEELKKLETVTVPVEKTQKQAVDMEKRLTKLYRNLELHSRAIDGFTSLEANMQLQAEVVIHAINEDGGSVPVKRKVYTKKGGLAVFECEFGHKGRIYWSQGTGPKKQVWAVGTKNTQNRDLAFIDSL